MTDSQTPADTAATDCDNCGVTIDDPINQLACPECGTDMIEAILGGGSR